MPCREMGQMHTVFPQMPAERISALHVVDRTKIGVGKLTRNYILVVAYENYQLDQLEEGINICS